MANLTNDQINLIFFSVQTEEQQNEIRTQMQQEAVRLESILNESREAFKKIRNR